MSDELKLIAKRLNAAFVSDPSATRQALAEALPEAIRSLAAIATGTAARMAAIDELLKLAARVVREDLARATAAVRRREAEVKIIEARVAEIKIKVEREREARRKRATVAKAIRDIKTARKIEPAVE